VSVDLWFGTLCLNNCTQAELVTTFRLKLTFKHKLKLELFYLAANGVKSTD